MCFIVVSIGHELVSRINLRKFVLRMHILRMHTTRKFVMFQYHSSHAYQTEVCYVSLSIVRKYILRKFVMFHYQSVVSLLCFNTFTEITSNMNNILMCIITRKFVMFQYPHMNNILHKHIPSRINRS